MRLSTDTNDASAIRAANDASSSTDELINIAEIILKAVSRLINARQVAGARMASNYTNTASLDGEAVIF